VDYNEFCPKCGSLLRVHNVYGDQYQMICLNPNCHNYAGQDLNVNTVKIIVDTIEIADTNTVTDTTITTNTDTTTIDTTTIPSDTITTESTTTEATTTPPDSTPIDNGVNLSG
jgi:hypothetical protein